MKKLIILLSYVLINSNAAIAVDIPEIMKQTMSHETGMPSLLNLVVSMVLVIALIYITGWIYAKLNVLNRDKLNKISSKNDEVFKFKVLQSMPLGQQRYLYSVEMNDKVLLIASAQNHINVLREFDLSQKKESNLNDNTEQTFIKETVKETIDSPLETKKSINIDELYKKYKN